MPLAPGTSIIDLRPDADRAEQPLPGAITLSLEVIEAGQHGFTPQHGPLLVICERGTRSALAARYLRADGLDAQPWRGTLKELISEVQASS